MSQYQDETKKKPLIQYSKMKYNQPTVAIKDKMKKQKSAQKQNIYEPQTKKFKDFNQSKYTMQYQTDNNMQIFKKPNPTSQNIPLTPSNIQMSNNMNLTKNLSFGIVKNNQKNYITTNNNQKNYMTTNGNQNQISSNNPIISVNVNIQNVPSNMMEYKKTLGPKYEVKPMASKRTLQNQRLVQPQVSMHNQRMVNHNNQRNIKIEQDKRKINNTMNCTTERFMERNSMLDRTTVDKNHQRNDKKQKFKKQFQEKFIMAASPTNAVDTDFLCDEELDIKPIEKKPLLYEKKLSEKKLSIPQISHHTQLPSQNPSNTQTQVPSMQPTALTSQWGYAKKVDRKTMQKELKQFEAKEEEINLIQCSQAINVMFSQQQKYMVDPTYLEKHQKSVNWMIRAILLDWMRQLSYQYALKRDTYHLAVVLLDNYLAKKSNVHKQVAQVIGATTLFIASKLQELQCRPSQSFAESTQGICSAKDIQTWQLQICKTLQFHLNPPTLYSLANRIMKQWDKYIDEVDYAMHHPCFEGKDKAYFKKLDQSSYRMFRQLLQFVDCVILDVQTAQYKPLLIILSLMYLIIGVKVAGFQHDEIHQVFPRGSHYLLDRSNYFNDLFENFVGSTFGLTLLEILPSVQYTASYFNLSLTFEKPILGEDEESLQEMQLEEYCSYQTYNRHMLKTVTNRFRGIMNAF